MEIVRKDKKAVLRQRSPFQWIVVEKVLKGMTLGQLTLRVFGEEDIIIGKGEKGPRATLEVHDKRFFRDCVLYADIGLGETYTKGYWDTPSIKDLISWMIYNMESNPAISGGSQKIQLNLLGALNRMTHILNRNGLKGGEKNIHAHYDISNDFFKLFLDKSMMYSSGLFESTDTTLAEAQVAKCRKLAESLKLCKEDHVLEIGCGWGEMSMFMAREYGCRVTGITISKEQYQLAIERVKSAGLEHLIDIQFKDYRKLKGKFSKIVSIEMIEAVGHEFYPTFFKKCDDLLDENGLIGIQAITSPDSRYDSFRKGVDWIQKHIFPGSLLPSIGEMTRVTTKYTNLHLHSLVDFGTSYSKTLDLWNENLHKKKPEVLEMMKDESFFRSWKYYLEYCSAAFSTKNISVVQLVLTRPNNESLQS